MDLPQSTVSRVLSGKSGWGIPEGMAPVAGMHIQKLNARVTPELRATIFELRSQGLTHQAIADQVGLTRPYVTTILNRARGVPKQPTGEQAGAQTTSAVVAAAD